MPEPNPPNPSINYFEHVMALVVVFITAIAYVVYRKRPQND